MRNVLYAQGGGSTHVINASARGLFEACRNYPDRIGTVFAARFGIEGVLQEDLLDVSAQHPEEIALLSATPASGIFGSCRYRLDDSCEEDFERVLDVCAAHDIGYFFYNGGNDSMDTAEKISRRAINRGQELIVTGIPKTVDNDLGNDSEVLIDHTPGYGSTARFWAYTVREADQENAGACRFEPVLVLQAMGRKVGFIPAAARLGDPDREIPLLIFMPEAGLSLEEMTDRVSDMVRARGRAVVIVGEGIEHGKSGTSIDGFGHPVFGTASVSAAQAISNRLNRSGLPVRGIARYNIPGTGQRNQPMMGSTIDIEEAYGHGKNALAIALNSGGGYMSTLLRRPGSEYKVYYDKVPLSKIANTERTFPLSWLSPEKTDVTDGFLSYARPLIGDTFPAIPLLCGHERFARFSEIYASKKLSPYTPVNHR